MGFSFNLTQPMETAPISLLEEVGKQLRGVVSYVDGYGTHEVVESLGEIVEADKASIPVIRGNSLYTIVDGLYWSDSENQANRIGGNLVTISSQNENKFVLEKFGDKAIELAKERGQNHEKTNLHIGLNDLQNEGEWVWSSGEIVAWENWNPGEPANGTEGNHAGLLVNWWEEGKWHDLYDSYIRGDEANVGVAEIPFIRRGDSAYVIVEGPPGRSRS